jgi:hypothetical protein
MISVLGPISLFNTRTVMLGFLAQLTEKWSNWCGDRELEMAIRRHLTTDGHYGGSAKLKAVRLAAVQRPGWLQVYRFDVVVRSRSVDESDDAVDAAAQYVTLFGLVKEDVRKNETIVRTFDSPEARRELFELWSVDLIQLRSGRALL